MQSFTRVLPTLNPRKEYWRPALPTSDGKERMGTYGMTAPATRKSGTSAME